MLACCIYLMFLSKQTKVLRKLSAESQYLTLLKTFQLVICSIFNKTVNSSVLNFYVREKSNMTSLMSSPKTLAQTQKLYFRDAEEKSPNRDQRVRAVCGNYT